MHNRRSPQLKNRTATLSAKSKRFHWSVCDCPVEKGLTLDDILALDASGQGELAETKCRAAIERNSKDAYAHFALGSLFVNRGKFEMAIQSLKIAIKLSPNNSEAHGNLGLAYKGLKQTEDAWRSMQRAVELSPFSGDAWTNLGAMAIAEADFLAAKGPCAKAAALAPASVPAHLNLGMVQAICGDYIDAIGSLEVCLAHDPTHAAAHWNISLILLLLGQFRAGLTQYEWRPSRRGASQVPDALPDLSELNSVRVNAEQGYGDSIHFVRYLKLLVEHGIDVEFGCPPGLSELMSQSLSEKIQVVNPQTPSQADAIVLLMSLPHLFGTEIDTIPNATPYLKADVQKTTDWNLKLNAHENTSQLKVGIAWAGSPTHTNDRNRSIDLEQLIPLTQIDGISFYSLQVGASAARLPDFPESGIIDLGPDITAYSDTAAIIENLDRVIAVDTSVVHLAGALGKPVWNLVSFASDWRWLLDRDDSPWYPTMRIFRQPRLGDWQSVLHKVHSELVKMLARKIGNVDSSLADLNDALKNGLSSDAVALSGSLQSRFPDDLVVLNSLAVLYWSAGQLTETLKFLVSALEIDPTDRTTVCNCVDVFERCSFIDDAIALLHAYQNAHPNDCSMNMRLGALLTQATSQVAA